MPSENFKKLDKFISEEMQMAHIYQPVMLIELLLNNGKANVTDIAKSILKRDESQIEYYEQITKNMVGRVLTKNRGITQKNKDEYSLIGYQELSENETEELVNLCQGKIDEFIGKRGNAVWSHRKKSSGYISGTIKYEVLKRAKFRCELCGISAEEKALEVDHIIPRNEGGSDDISNLQALCYSCNSMKRDKDNTDFRQMAESYNHREENCLFCEIGKDSIIASNELCYAIRDGYPVTEHHTLIIPNRHVSDYFNLYQPELNAVNQMLNLMKDEIKEKDSSVTSFNIGMNCGKDAGQTVFHCHIHLLPRREGDVEDPRGGVRSVIPNKKTY